MIKPSTNSRKLQVSNGHYMDFDDLARLLSVITEGLGSSPLRMADLAEATGLPFRQVRNRISIARALGVMKSGKLVPTSFGLYIVKHDLFCEARGTLEFMHYKAAGNFTNLVWFEVFQSLLPKLSPMPYEGWLKYFQDALKDEYSEHSIHDHVGKEVRFLIEVYTKNRLKKLLVLHEAEDGRLYPRRTTELTPKILAAMIYDFGLRAETELLQIDSLMTEPGSPGVLFALERQTLRGMAEEMHRSGWLRYESTHNLDQLRLQAGFTSVDFLSAYYEDVDPTPSQGEGAL